jgi:hypothetical protein
LDLGIGHAFALQERSSGSTAARPNTVERYGRSLGQIQLGD